MPVITPEPAHNPALSKGQLITLRWDPQGRTKRARFIRWTRTGMAVVQVEGVTAKGEPTGFGSPRNFERHDIVGVES